MGVFDLAVQFEQLAGHPGDQHSSGRLAWQLDTLGSCGSHGTGGHLRHLPGLRPVLTQEPAQRLWSGFADGLWGLAAADQDQCAAGGVAKGAFQGGEHRGEQVTQPADPADPAGHQVGAVGSEPGQLGNQLLP